MRELDRRVWVVVVDVKTADSLSPRGSRWRAPVRCLSSSVRLCCRSPGRNQARIGGRRVPDFAGGDGHRDSEARAPAAVWHPLRDRRECDSRLSPPAESASWLESDSPRRMSRALARFDFGHQRAPVREDRYERCAMTAAIGPAGHAAGSPAWTPLVAPACSYSVFVSSAIWFAVWWIRWELGRPDSDGGDGDGEPRSGSGSCGD